MLRIIRDLYRHEAWADAEHLRAIQAHPPASQDPEIQRRLDHMHECQSWYLAQFKGEDSTGEPLPAGRYYREMREWLDSVTDEALEREIRFPIPGQPVAPFSEALLQVVMHSQYHRGQNAKRLRELGGEPPTTDYILWVLKGRPEPAPVAGR